MKRAGPQTLEALSTLLAGLRRLPYLVERKPGIFYRRAEAYLHFHEDTAGLFADVKLSGAGFDRLSVNTAQEQQMLLQRITHNLN